MAKFNTTATRSKLGNSPLVAESIPSGKTHEGAPGYAHDDKSALFLLAVTNFVGEDTFYEKAADRDARFRDLVRKVAVADSRWFASFASWLRSDANMRSAPVVAALEGASALRSAGYKASDGAPTIRSIVSSVLQRPDEPGEALAYWLNTYGRAIPMPVKRGIADAALRLYSEYPLLKYDTSTHGVRFADVLDLTHPGDHVASRQRKLVKGQWQRDLFVHALARRHNRDNPTPETLTMIRANDELRTLLADEPFAALDTDRLKVAGMTWEDVLSLVGSKVDKAKLWEALIPIMGYMALLRNLRNFDEAGVSDEVAAKVSARLSDPEQVAKSRQFPYRFLAAYEQAPSLRWSQPLDTALNHVLANVPSIANSLVLIDTSASMSSTSFSKRSKMTPGKAAAVFGVVLAARGEADVFGFADGVFRHNVPKGASVIREVDRFVRRTGEVGYGTQIAYAIRSTFQPDRHKRVFVFSDMQTFDDYQGEVTNAVPADVPIYGFNLGGHQHTAFDAGRPNRIEFGGLTDATFRMIPLIEAGKNAAWPWE